MQRISDINTNLNNTLAKRKQMASLLDQAFSDAPQEMDELLKAIGKAYYSGKVFRFWDVLASLSGSDRGYGNDWFFAAIELQKQKEAKE